jgi:hypothetical protein
MLYSYPKLSEGGYRWNCLQRILNTIGIEPTGLSDIGAETVVDFSRELTEQEKTILDSVMADNPCYPPSLTGSRFIIADVWNRRAEIFSDIGYEYDVYYSESIPGSNNIDQIELHFNQSLTLDQINKVMNAYSNLIRLDNG